MSKGAKSSTEKHVKVYDDLTAIKGIRDARQQWFRDTMKVHTYRDLAALSVDEIEAGLKAERQFPSRSMIAAWIAQAKALAEAVEQDNPMSKRKVVVEPPAWTTQASFVIEFQRLDHKDGSREQRMTVHHIETDTNQIWWELKADDAMRWMLAEAGLEVTDTAPPVETIIPNTSAYQTGYSDKLQPALAKVDRLSNRPTSGNESKASPTLIVMKPAAQPTGFSDRMREVLARTHNT